MEKKKELLLDEELVAYVRGLIYDKMKEDMTNYIHREIDIAVAKKYEQMVNYPLSVKEVARMIGKSEQAVYKMIQRDQLPYTKVGKMVFISLRDLQKPLSIKRDKDDDDK
jgi:excisionase family DNA binding protein